MSSAMSTPAVAGRSPSPRRKREGARLARAAPGSLTRLALALVACFHMATAAIAISPDEQLDDPVLEARARAISKQLRCVICQSQSIDESNVSLARDLRELVRERLVAGDTDEEVVDYVVDRYGDYVRLAPAVTGRTLLLWSAPVLFLILGGAVVVLVLRQSMRAPLDGADEASGGSESRA